MSRFFVVDHLRVASENLGLHGVFVFQILFASFEGLSDSDLLRGGRDVAFGWLEIAGRKALE